MILFGITAAFAKVQAPDAIPKFGVRYLFIPHPFATNYPLDYSIGQSVRLACLSHAASVRSEPGSNSSICIVDYAPAGAVSSKIWTQRFAHATKVKSVVAETNLATNTLILEAATKRE